MVKLWLTRPRAYAERTAEFLLDFDVIVYPLLEYRLLPAPIIEWGLGDSVAFTSAFAVESFGGAYSKRDFRAFCVGDSTAAMAVSLGIEDVISADGDVDLLGELIISRGVKSRIWHFASEETAGDLAGVLREHGLNVRKVALYASDNVMELSSEICDELATGVIGGVLLYSPKTAVSFMNLVSDLGSLSSLQIFCLSPNVAREVSGLGQIWVADQPKEEFLLKLIRERFERG